MLPPFSTRGEFSRQNGPAGLPAEQHAKALSDATIALFERSERKSTTSESAR
ncbi:hypothetical protein [Bosea sp. Root483D1]|uniref:hypothetical protein n=1 Tax=Bosea sp. Root483D1 TaxID=1736544 RepID=UPI00138F814C|nr:hypothetical protein [Bosea sp. Root483D1]